MIVGKRGVIWLLATVATLASLVQGEAAQIDQENWVPQSANTWISGQEQEFTPTLDTLDSVQLWMPGGILNPVAYAGGVSSINILQGSVNGPVIAASSPVYTAPFYEGTVGFGFSQPVPLVPGQVYVLEPRWLSGGGGLFASSRPASYSGGRLFANGQLIDANLIFREGVGLDLVPEPTPIVLAFLGLMVIVGKSRFRL